MKKGIVLLLVGMFYLTVQSDAQNAIRRIETKHFKAVETPEGVEKGEQLFEVTPDYHYSLQEFRQDGKLILEKTIFIPSFSDTQTELITRYEYAGDQLSSKTVLEDKEIKTVYKYEYDAVGQLLQETVLEKGRTVRAENSFRYDTTGNQLYACYKYSEEDVESGVCAQSVVYAYDEEGKKVEECWSTADDITRCEKFEYDDKDSLITVSSVVNDEVFATVENIFDNSGRKIETIERKGIITEITKYDSLSNVLSFRQLDAEENLVVEEISEYSYEEERKTKNWRQLNHQGEIIAESIYVFDQFENLTHHSSLIQLGPDVLESSYSREYQYDENGNWTLKIERRDGRPIVVAERTIEYY
ncbi:MAG: hypothetical protein AAFZ63_11030 [Bacteroidota bacterium]